MNATVIGGGIGGLTAALALRTRGIEATVYEAAGELRPVGTGLLLSPNALQLLARLELADAVIERGWPLERAEIHDARSGMPQRINMANSVRRYGLPTAAIHRHRLHELLAAALGEEQIRLGSTATAIGDGDLHPSVSFSDGRRADAGVVIGADGLRSTVRAYVAPQVPLRYSGQTSWRGIGLRTSRSAGVRLA